MKRTGIFGGSFNPPHTGHLLIAQEALNQLGLDRIVWIPAKTPPHKKLEGNAADLDRAEMVRRTIAGNDQFTMSLIEFEREGPSYTIDTIRQLIASENGQEFTFIIGGDMIQSLPSWKEIDVLQTLVKFAGVKRKDYLTDEAWNVYGVSVVEMPILEISSTFIRKRVQSGGNIRYYVPEDVKEYIEEKGLYGSSKSS